MNRKTWVIALVVVLIAALAVPVAMAQRHRRSGGDGELGPFAKIHRLKAQLDLSDAQTSEIRDIAFEVRDANREHRAAMRASMLETGKVLIANPDDLATARSLLSRNAETEAAMKSNVLKGVSDALKVLTPEQRAKLATILEQHFAEK